MLCALLAFIHPGDEVVTFEPFFDQYVSHGQDIVSTGLTTSHRVIDIEAELNWQVVFLAMCLFTRQRTAVEQYQVHPNGQLTLKSLRKP